VERKTVNLSEDDLAALKPFLERGSRQQEELAASVGEERAPYLSESSALRALALVGKRAIEEKLLAEGYEALATAYAPEDAAWAEDAMELAEEASATGSPHA